MCTRHVCAVCISSPRLSCATKFSVIDTVQCVDILLTLFSLEISCDLCDYDNFGCLLQLMLKWRDQLTQLNQHLSSTVLLKTFINGVILAACVCALDDKGHEAVINYQSIVALASVLVAQLLDEWMSCYSSQRIFNSMKRLVQTIQEFTARQSIQCYRTLTGSSKQNEEGTSTNNSMVAIDCAGRGHRQVSDIEHRCLEQVTAMAPSFCFTVKDMFDLRTLTMLILLSNVLNYAVILIQTQ